jgi:hypothetical protein
MYDNLTYLFFLLCLLCGRLLFSNEWIRFLMIERTSDRVYDATRAGKVHTRIA